MAIDVRMGLWWCRWGRSGPDRGFGLPNLGAKVQFDVLPVVIVSLRWRIGQAGALAKLSDLLIMRLLLLQSLSLRVAPFGSIF